MAKPDIDKVLAGLKSYAYGWRKMLPASFGLFLNHRVGIDIQTRLVPKKSAPPKVNAAETSLARTILGKLPQLLEEVEDRFTRYEKRPKARAQACKPHIWIERETVEEEAGRWTFVIERADAADYGYHVEFDELTCIEVWAGD